MSLIFYAKKSIQTKLALEHIQRIFSDAINNPKKNSEIMSLLSDDWYVRINFNDNRFQIAAGRNGQWYERTGIHSILKGRIKENKDTRENTISMIVRPSNEYIISLSLVFLFVTAILFYAVQNNIRSLLMISAILLFLWYVLFLIDFNFQVKRYKKILNSFFY